MKFFDYEGTKLYYTDMDKREDKSRGVPIVFVHGAGSSHHIWTLQVLDFNETNRVIALDLSGHGQSEDTGKRLDVERGFTAEVAALVEHLGLDDFVLVGHSMGGGVVMAYALNKDYPQPCALVLVGTSCDLDLNKIGLGLIREAFDDETLDYEISDLDDDLKTFSIMDFQKAATKFNGQTIFRDLRACDRFDVTERVGEITLPTFILVGEDDDIVPPHVAKKLEEALPRADIAVVKESDHAPMVEAPEIFNRLLRGFLDWVEKNIAKKQ